MPYEKDMEKVLCIAADAAKELGVSKGFNHNRDLALEVVNANDRHVFRIRDHVEEDPSFLQLIPYCVLFSKAAGDVRYLAYDRGKSGGEDRLHAKLSIGVGGHINPIDADDGQHLFRSGMHREVSEEVVLQGEPIFECQGMIYDPSDKVGRVHLAVIYTAEVPEAKVEAREDCLENARMLTKDQLRKRADQMESWSRLVLENVL